jgi:5-methyltetrahydrofolate--homocysteine methyltransferase
MSTEILEKLHNAILTWDAKKSKKLTVEAIESGINPLEIIDQVLRPCLKSLGDDFEASIIFLPELVAVGEIATEIGNIVGEAMIGKGEIPTQASIALGTVKGDMHSIGKNIVAVMMKASGFKVTDLGVDVTPEEFLEVASDVDIVAMSGLLTTATRGMKEVIEKVSAQYPDKIIITGGAAMNPELAEALAVLYGPDAAAGVRILREVLEQND